MLQPYILGNRVECGTDEAGRGCLAGPVTAAAIILPPDFTHPVLTDSKQLTHVQREELAVILKAEAISYYVTHIFEGEIDQLNILNASIKAMHVSINGLRTKPDHIAVDGNRFHSYPDIPHSCIIKGDGKYLHIAAASILAKTGRDTYMKQLHDEFPMYNWKKNKGYPTQEHRTVIRKYGVSKYHRRSFRLLPDQLLLDFEGK